MYRHGWFQIAFERDLTEAVTPLRLFGRRLVAVRQPDGKLGVFSATCPHRGADLSKGGRLFDDGTLRCPFHGLRIHLGHVAEERLSATSYATAVAGGLVFVRLSDDDAPSPAEAIEALAETHQIVPGFSLEMKTALEVVSENGWDAAHFKAVHGLPATPRMTTHPGPKGQLVSEGEFVIPRSGWYETRGRGDLRTTFHAEAFSPGLVIANLAGSPPFNYTVITGAVSHDEPEACTIRISLGLPRSAPQAEAFVESLLAVSRRGLEEDRVIWENLDLDAPSSLEPGDDLFEAFHGFCRRFGEPRDRRLTQAASGR